MFSEMNYKISLIFTLGIMQQMFKKNHLHISLIAHLSYQLFRRPLCSFVIIIEEKR